MGNEGISSSSSSSLFAGLLREGALNGSEDGAARLLLLLPLLPQPVLSSRSILSV